MNWLIALTSILGVLMWLALIVASIFERVQEQGRQ